MDKLIVPWRTVRSLCNKVCKDLKKNVPEIRSFNVVALSKGGLIPGTIMCNILGVDKLYALGIKSYNNESRGDIEIYQVPHFADMQNILIVDDISDSGASFIHIIKMLGELKQVKTAALYCKPNTTYKPDFCGKCDISESSWIVFPWE